MQLQSAVKKTTAKVTAATACGTLVMILAFFGLHLLIPESVPFDHRVILGGIGGCLVASANFFLMSLTVQGVTDRGGTVDPVEREQAFTLLKRSYRLRMIFQILWIILAIVLPFLNPAAGIIPLFLPSALIKLLDRLGLLADK